MIFHRRYNTATATAPFTIRIPMIKRGAVDYATSSDWTPATGDAKISKDGTVANLTYLPVYYDGYWEFYFDAAEMTCKQAVIIVIDSATKAVEDQMFVIETFGHPSAMIPKDLHADVYDDDIRFARAVKTNVLGTVGSGSTTTSIVTSLLDPAAAIADQFKGRIVLFDRLTTTVNLRGQGSDITASSSVGVLTVSALSTAPVSGDTFVIL